MSAYAAAAAARNSAIADGGQGGRRSTERTTLWANIALVSEVDGELQVTAYISRLPLDNIHEWKANFGTSQQRFLSEKIWMRMRETAAALEPGQTTVFGAKMGEYKRGLNILLSRVNSVTDDSTGEDLVDSAISDI